MTKEKYLRLLNTPWKMNLFLFQKLPGAWFMGVRLRACDGKTCTVELPYGWRSQNPFRSIYFAALAAAGELSTGMLGQAHLQERPPVSMLVRRVEAEFLKKAAATVTFTCEQGEAVESTIERAIATGEAQEINMTSVGRLPNGDIACRVLINWTFKKRN